MRLLTKERWAHRNVFETYLLMGPSRTFKALSDATGINQASLKIWNKSFGWQARLEKRDARAMAKLEEANDKVYLENVKIRHQEAFKTVQDKALGYLESKSANFRKSKSPGRDATIALNIAITGERKVLGLEDTKIRGAIAKEGIAALFEVVMGS